MNKPNLKNTLSLFRYQEKTMQLVGYFINNDEAERVAPSRKGLSINYQNTYYTSPLEVGASQEDLTQLQVKKYFPKTHNRYRAICGGYGIVWLFKRYDEPIAMSMRKHIAKTPEQAVIDYFVFNKVLPLAISDNLFAELADRVLLHRDLYFTRQGVDIKLAYNVLGITQRKREAERLKNNVAPVADYDHDLQCDAQIDALLKGGFIAFDFDGVNYQLPRLVLTALTSYIYKEQKDKSYFEDGEFIWFFDGKIDLEQDYLFDLIFLIGNLPKKDRHSDYLKNLIIKSSLSTECFDYLKQKETYKK